MRHEEALTAHTLFVARHRLRGREAGLFSTAVKSHSGHVCSEATCNFLKTWQRFARPGSVRTRSEARSHLTCQQPAGKPLRKQDSTSAIRIAQPPRITTPGSRNPCEHGRPAAAGPRFVTNAILRSGWPADSAATAPFPVCRTSAVLPSERYACDHRRPVPP